MQPLFTLHQVSKLLNIPASTLRYWEQQGLVRFERDLTNHYRQVSLHTLLNIIDVMEFRDMDIAIEQVKHMPTMNEAALFQLLSENKRKLEQKIRQTQKIIRQIEFKQQALERIEQLKSQPLLVEEIRRVNTVYAVDIACAEDMKNYLKPFQSANIFSPDNLTQPQFGMFLPSQSKKIIKPEDLNPKPYLTGLVYWNNRTGENNLPALFTAAEKAGYRPQQIICQFLSFAHDPQLGLRDCFETWIEISD